MDLTDDPDILRKTRLKILLSWTEKTSLASGFQSYQHFVPSDRLHTLSISDPHSIEGKDSFSFTVEILIHKTKQTVMEGMNQTYWMTTI